jgi:hypothetical protein
MPDYFSAVGQAVCRALAKHQLDEHLAGPVMATDAMPRDLGPRYGDQENLEPRGAEMWNTNSNGNGNGDQNGEAVPSADELMAMIRMVLSRMPDSEAFLAQLTDLVATADPDAAGEVNEDTGLPDNNMGSLDRSRSGRRGSAHDRQLAQDRKARLMAHDRRIRDSASFNKRWGGLVGGVSVDMMRSSRR